MANYCQCRHPQLKHLYGGYGSCNQFKCVCDGYNFMYLKKNCDFCENSVYWISENGEAYCFACITKVTDDSFRKILNELDCEEKQPLESAVADDFNSSATSKDGSFLERLG